MPPTSGRASTPRPLRTRTELQSVRPSAESRRTGKASVPTPHPQAPMIRSPVVSRPAPRRFSALLLPAVIAALTGACDPPSGPAGSTPNTSASTAAATPPPAPPSSAKAALPPPVSREGQALARSPSAPVLFLADEDHAVLRRVPLTDTLLKPPPITDPPTVARVDAGEAKFPMPGRPAQVIALADRVLVTVRDPGLLLVLDAADPAKEIARVAVPADAWGLAVSPDLGTAYVTSAWTHSLTAVDLAAARVRWSVDTAREPRGVAASPDGKTVYVNHLVGAPLTVVDVTGEREVTPTRLPFPPDPLRTRYNETISASLGYAVLLAPDGRRLYVARHALGAASAWQGSPTIDVVSTVTNAPIAAVRKAPPFGTLTTDELKSNTWDADEAGLRVGTSTIPMVQPRAIAYRRKTHHLLVASEGTAALVELDALSIAPALQRNRVYQLGGLAPEKPTDIMIPPHCGAPTGVALSADDEVAFAYCRSTDNLVAVRLTPDGARELREETSFVAKATWNRRESTWGPFAYAKLDVAPTAPEDEELALGRRLFYDANDPVVSGGMGCAGCHPEGRDDAHTWRELKKYSTDKLPTFIAGPSIAPQDERTDGIHHGVARQTPMLAGRVDAVGPYGWHAESADLVGRIKAGFSLHRWWDFPADGLTMRRRAQPIAVFLRKGLVPPPREARARTAEEARGEEIFMSPKAQCATCHAPKTGFTDRSANLPLRGFKAPRFFDEDPNRAYKVPSLLFVGGTPPYYHDGSVETLEDLIVKNADRMGRTSHLSDEELRALVAYLRTL